MPRDPIGPPGFGPEYDARPDPTSRGVGPRISVLTRGWAAALAALVIGLGYQAGPPPIAPARRTGARWLHRFTCACGCGRSAQRGNCHSGADHCLDVLSCSGVAVVIGDGVEVSEGTRVLMRRGGQHEI